jgi:ABC-type multidrug transport system fused ATPase/permease subunit
MTLFLKKLNTTELMKAVNKVYIQIQSCKATKKKLAFLEVFSQLCFLYVIGLIVLTYFIDFSLLESVGTGDSYIINSLGMIVYGVMLIFVLGMSLTAMLVKIYFNLQITNYLEDIYKQLDRMKEVLNFFEVSPESLISSEFTEQDPRQITFSRDTLDSNFHALYKSETNRILCALESQFLEELRESERELSKRRSRKTLFRIHSINEEFEPESPTKARAREIKSNQMVTKDNLINWIKHHAKSSKRRIEYLEKEFTDLTEVVRYKFLGCLEINSSFLIKFLAALATTTITSVVALMNITIRII